jgi:WD40 repeat protein
VEDAGDVPFLVMEYILGVSLEDRIQRSGHLKVEEILRIGMQAASGLAAAHAQGLVHRDIKPSNILLENGVERVKITDFGLARVIHEAQLTQTNMAAGTPQYMSPEQARGTPVDHRSDLFSLGCVMYAMCVGRSPFRAETPSGAIHRVCEDTQRPIREVNPEIPDWLVAIIDRLLEKKPEDRFQTADEVAEVLGEYLAHVQQPSRVGLPARLKRPLRPLGGPKWLSAALATSVAAVLIGLTGFWLFSQPSSRPGVSFVDLQPYANRFLIESAEPIYHENNLAELKPGVLDVDGIPIQVSDRYIQLGGTNVPGCPEGVQGIAVNRTVGKVHFLHGSMYTFPEHGATVATYTFHYDDGSREVFPVISGRHLHDWHNWGDMPRPATSAKVAWRGSNPHVAQKARHLELFLCSWVNPYPDKRISTIDFERGPRPFPAPFCIGITCDDDQTPLPEEPGLLDVKIEGWAGGERCAVVLPGQKMRPMMGKNSRHYALLPAGSHPLEIRENKTVVRRGTITITPGGRAFVKAGIAATMFPLATPQPTPEADLTGQTWGIWNIALSRDETLMATAGGDGTIVLWQTTGGAWSKQATLESASYRIYSVAFSPDGQILASAAESGALRLWDVSTKKVVAELKQDSTESGNVGVFSVAFSPDGKTMVSGNGDGTLDFWNTATGERVATIAAHSNSVRATAFSPDGRLLATGSRQENVVKVWDLASRQPKFVLYGHTDSVVGVAFSPNGQTLASVSLDTSVRIWSLETGKLLDRFFTPDGLVAVTFSPDGKRLATGGRFQTVHIWDVAARRIVHEFQAHWEDVRFLAFAHNGEVLISGSGDNSTRVWSVAGLPGPFEAEASGVQPRECFVVTADWSNCALFSGIGDGAVAGIGFMAKCRVWDRKSLATLADFAVRPNGKGKPFSIMGQNSALFARDGKSLVTCTSINNAPPEIATWDTENYQRHARFEFSPKPLTWSKYVAVLANAVLDRDGKRLIVASSPQSLIGALELDSGASLWSVPSLHGVPTMIAMSPDDKFAAVGTELGQVMLIAAESGKEIREALGHGKTWVTTVAFSPNEPILVSGGSDCVIKVWDLNSFKSQTFPSAHVEKITSASFSPDGRLLVTTGGAWMNDAPFFKHKGEVCLWDIANQKLLAKFHAHYGSVTSAIFSPDGKSIATTGRDGKLLLWDVAELLKYGLGTEAAANSEPISHQADKAGEKRS